MKSRCDRSELSRTQICEKNLSLCPKSPLTADLQLQRDLNSWPKSQIEILRLQKSISVFVPLPFSVFTLYFNPGWLIQGFSLPKEEAYTSVLLIGIQKEAHSQVLHLSRNKRYTLTPEKLKWDKFKLTYKYSPFLRR